MDWKELSQKGVWAVALIVTGALVWKGAMDKVYFVGLLGLLVPSPMFQIPKGVS
jgi:hypothetical protein